MADVTRKIGLSLGADICWPICYEEIVKRLKLAIPHGGDTVRIEVDRVTIEPFDLRQPCTYDVVLDRLTHWYHTSREWIKKSILMDGLYVLNNPWSVQSNEKHTSYCAMIQLGMPIPPTVMVPPKAYEELPDLKITLKQYAKLFDLGTIGKQLGYPLFMKPYDGGGWKGVSRIDDEKKLKTAYEDSGKLVMHLQKAVDPFDCFTRCIGLGPQTHLVRYDPTAALHDRYTMDVEKSFVSADEAQLLKDTTLTINAFFGWDFNSCEALRQNGTWYPIDFANPCPDSQVTSLHYHFPWLVKANIRWSIFCAVTKKKFRRNLDWAPFYGIAAEPGMPYREKLRAYAKIAAQRFETERFEEFCATHLEHLDEVTHEFFTTPVAKDAVKKKTAALFPAHEVDQFTELFWKRIQKWRAEGMKTTERWRSERLERDITLVRWGHLGQPVLLFPTAGGDCEEIERFQMISVLEPLIHAGKIKVYSCDSAAGKALLAREGSARHQMWLQDQFHRYVRHEVVPAIRRDCKSPDIEVWAAGASIGAFHSVAMVCRFPDVFTKAIAMSGTYDLRRFYEAGPNEFSDEFWVSSPLHFVPTLAGRHLDVLRTRFVLMPSGEGRAEDISESWNMANTLGRMGIPNRVDSWGKDWHHDWVTWRKMLPQVLGEWTRG